MKKLTIKVITMMVVIVFVVAAMAVPASAVYISYNDWIYTAETNTTGKTIAIFSGIWSDDNVSSRYMSLYSYCQGGPVDSFSTSMNMSIRQWQDGGLRVVEYEMYSTEDDGGRTFEDSLDLTGSACLEQARGMVFQMCMSLTDSEDNWTMQYVHDWDCDRDGWIEPRL